MIPPYQCYTLHNLDASDSKINIIFKSSVIYVVFFVYVIYKPIMKQNICLRNCIPQGSNVEPLLFISYINDLSAM